MASWRTRARVGVLILALLVGGVSGWSLRGGDGTGADEPRTTAPHRSGAGGVAAWIDGRVREGGEDFVVLDVPGGTAQPRILRIEHVRWRPAPGVRLVVPPPSGMTVCARVALGAHPVRSGTFEDGTVIEGARCSFRSAA